MCRGFQKSRFIQTDVTSAFSAFPDTANPNSGTQVHSFRIRSTLSQGPIIKDAEGDSVLVTADGFLYGYCAFSQQRDKTLKRGYLQVRSPAMKCSEWDLNTQKTVEVSRILVAAPLSSSLFIHPCHGHNPVLAAWLRDAGNSLSQHF